MKTKLFLILILIFTYISNAQVSKNYKQLAKEKSINFYEIVNQSKKEFSKLDVNIVNNRKAKKQFLRWVYYWEDKVNPDGTFPNENTGYFNAGILDSNGKIIQPNTNYAARINNFSTQTWTSVSPEQSEIDNNGYSNYPQMGRLNAFLRIKHPTNTALDVLFVGAPNGGLWKSTDGGANWMPKLDFIASIGVTDIKTTPDATFANYTTKPIYISTGDYDGGNSKSIGVLKSTDGGETFNSTGLSYTITEQKHTGDLIVINDNIVFVGEKDGIFKTTNGGTNWSNAYNAGFTGLSMGRSARNGNEIMYTDVFGGVYYTSNYTDDVNWTTIVVPNSANKLAVTVDDNGDFYIQNESGQVKKFNKTSKSFTDIGNPPSFYEPQQGYNQALVVTNDIMISGEFNGQSSSNNGSTWTRTINGYWDPSAGTIPTSSGSVTSIGTYVHSDHHRMGRLDGSLEFWSVNDGGLNYFTFPSAGSISPTSIYKSSKVKVLQSYSVAINPSANDGAMIAANQDNDALSKRNGTWYAVSMGDGIQSAINYNNPDIRYAGNQGGYVSQTNTGFQEQLQGNGNNVEIPGANFYFPLEMHKTTPNILYGGGNDVYILDANTGLTINSANSSIGGTVTTIATHGNSVMAASTSLIRFSSNQGGTWSAINLPNIANNITSVDYDATNSNIMYVTNSGYTGGNKVWKSTNGGANWTNISGDLPNIVVNEIILKQGQSSEFLFLATELGVYYSKNEGTNWTKLGQGLPNVDVRDLDIHYTADKLVIATFGRGLWEINVANSTLGTETINDNIEVSIFPVPASNELFVKIPNSNEQFQYIIYNVVGGIVKKGNIDRNKSIDVSNLVSNIYLMRVYNNQASSTKKIIIE